MEFKDYYKILGVEPTATADEVKKAYRKLARKYHPDVSKEPDAAQRMSEVNEANTVLSDPEKRAAYDALRQQAAQGPGHDFRPPPNWDAGYEFSDFGGGDGYGGDFSDFFEQLFGRAARQGRTGHGAHGARHGFGSAAQRGSDHHAKIELDLLDAYQGAERQISLRGARLDASGHLVQEDRTLQVGIPKGVKEGQLIRLAGQGGPGHGGAAAGDLLLQVQLRVDPRWRAEGKDVYQRLRLAPWEAALGGSVRVGTPGGTLVDVNVPAGSGSGRKLRLKGRGIPTTQPGDLYLEIEPAIPGAVTDQQREAWQALAKAYPGFDPRMA